MHRSIHAALTGLLVAAMAGTASADIETVDVDEGTIGTRITITGADFGKQRPKVWLSSRTKGQRRVRLRVVSHSPTYILAEVKRGVPGRYTINVKPRARRAPTFSSPTTNEKFTILGPRIDNALGPAAPYEETTLTGTFFGTRQGRVRIGNRRCRVVDWSDQSITVVLHGLLVNGTHDVEIRTRVGKNVFPSAYTVHGSTAGFPRTDSFVATFRGGSLSPNRILSGYDADEKRWSVYAEREDGDGGSLEYFRASVPVDLDGPFPLELSQEDGVRGENGLDPFLSFVSDVRDFSAVNADALALGDPDVDPSSWTITFVAYNDGRLFGNITGILKEPDGSNVAMQCQFVVTVDASDD